MSAFVRRFDNNLIQLLTSNSFFQSALSPDIQKGEVFPAIRNNTMDFYHKGGNLFSFDKNGFTTHKKYAGLFDSPSQAWPEYVTEEQIKKYHSISSLNDIYERIKEYCALYSGIEAIGVSSIYHKNPFTDKTKNIVVLDIEISFEGLTAQRSIDMQQLVEQKEKIGAGSIYEDENKKDNDKPGLDRIDILLLDYSNGDSGKLKFVEAKNYINPEIRSTTIPKVIAQIERYNNQIAAKESEIIEEYKNYCRLMNKIFQLNLPSSITLDKKTSLLVFGFDNVQKSYNPYFDGLKKALNSEFIYRGSVDCLDHNNLYNMFFK